MSKELMQSDPSTSCFRIDPRTKMALLLTVCFFVLGNFGGTTLGILKIALSVIPFFLLLISGKMRTSILYIAIYGISLVADIWTVNVSNIIVGYIFIAVRVLFLRLMPNLMMGYYLVSTTTVSEFMSAMERMHVTEKLVIPMSVMFRFFPTVSEESQAISDAMRMRGIRFGGGNLMQMLEYRIVPMMMCSVKIGEELSAAALTRGLGAPIKRTNICKIGFLRLDYIILTMCFLCYALFLLEYAKFTV